MFAEGFLRHRVAAGRSAAPPRDGLEATLLALYDAGRQAWPHLPVSVDAFVHHLAIVVEDLDGLAALRGDDLYFAVACSTGVAGAAAIFEQQFSADIDAVIRRQGLSQRRDEIAQRLRRDLFVGTERRPPFLTTYGGRGPLRSWLKVVALRGAMDVARELAKARKREVGGDDVIFERAAATAPDAELDHLKAEYGPAVKRAFEHAFAALESRDRQLLRFQYIDGLNLDQTAALFRISRATAARHRKRAVERLLRATRDGLRSGLSLSDRECDSVMKLVRSQLDLSMSRLLRTGTPAP